jgi:SAM-dependent methyltransferase
VLFRSYDKKGLDFLSDLWLDKYNNIVNLIPRGKALDLGCGIGQYTKYLMDKGFDVISSDISSEALNVLSEHIENAKTIELDMSKKLPFEDNTFDLVFANLSIHYFDSATTVKVLKEIKRVIKNDGYFIGSVNSTQTFQFIKDKAIEIEPNYYYESGRNIRLWDITQFEIYFNECDKIALNEVTTKRWDRTKIMWEFIYKVKK